MYIPIFLLFHSNFEEYLSTPTYSTLTSPSLECLFIKSSDSYFSFWFGTTRGILKRNLGLGGSIPRWGWKCGWCGPAWPPRPAWGWWPKGGCGGACGGAWGACGGPTRPLCGMEDTTVAPEAGLEVGTVEAPTEVTALDDEKESWAACALKHK